MSCSSSLLPSTAEPQKGLFRTKNHWIWTSNHTAAFQKNKENLDENLYLLIPILSIKQSYVLNIYIKNIKRTGNQLNMLLIFIINRKMILPY